MYSLMHNNHLHNDIVLNKNLYIFVLRHVRITYLLQEYIVIYTANITTIMIRWYKHIVVGPKNKIIISRLLLKF